MGGTQLLDTYTLAISAENCLIQAGKLDLRPPTTLLPEIPQEPQPFVAPIPDQSSQPISSTSYSPT